MSGAKIMAMAISRDRLYLVLFTAYVAILVFATVGQLFHVDWILNLFDLKRVF